jgi:hypothetical protein
MNLVTTQRVSEVVAGTIACEPYDRIRKQWITKNLLGDLDVLSLVSSADVVDPPFFPFSKTVRIARRLSSNGYPVPSLPCGPLDREPLSMEPVRNKPPC